MVALSSGAVLLHFLIAIEFREQHLISLVTYDSHFGWARKTSTSLLRVKVSTRRVVLGRGVEQISDGTYRLGVMSVMRSKREVLQWGVESLGPSCIGDGAAASGGDGWRIYVANVVVDLLAVDDSPSGMAVEHLETR